MEQWGERFIGENKTGRKISASVPLHSPLIPYAATRGFTRGSGVRMHCLNVPSMAQPKDIYILCDHFGVKFHSH
jgi:hypothetical protein